MVSVCISEILASFKSPALSVHIAHGHEQIFVGIEMEIVACLVDSLMLQHITLNVNVPCCVVG